MYGDSDEEKGDMRKERNWGRGEVKGGGQKAAHSQNNFGDAVCVLPRRAAEHAVVCSNYRIQVRFCIIPMGPL